jgi:hypothetical protein
VERQQPFGAVYFLIIGFFFEASFEACPTVTLRDIPIERGVK